MMWSPLGTVAALAVAIAAAVVGGLAFARGHACGRLILVAAAAIAVGQLAAAGAAVAVDHLEGDLALQLADVGDVVAVLLRGSGSLALGVALLRAAPPRG